VLVALAVFAAWDREDSPSPSPTPEDRFSVFRRPALPSDDPRRAAGVLRALEEGVVRRFGLDFERARRVAPSVFAVPGRGVICLVRTRGGSACSPAAVAGRNFVTTSCAGLPSGVVAVSGLVPDGARDVSVRLRSGRTVPARVSSNYLDERLRVRRAGDLPVAVEWKPDAVYRVPRTELGDLRCASR
jgi:hypothetical protein